MANLVVSSLSLRYLAVNGMPFSDSLVWRGAICLLFVFAFARRRKMALVPKSISTQLLRALIAGLALTLYTLSYNWLTASAISVLSNIDVPLLMVLGPLVGVRASWRVRLLSLLSIVCLAWFVSNFEVQNGLLYGLGALMISTFLLCFGYLFIKRSMAEENETVTILTPALAIFGYGLLENGGHLEGLTSDLLLATIFSGASMFGAYWTTIRLYKHADLASAEFPSLIAAIFVQPMESVLLHEPMRATYLLSSLVFIALIYLVLNLRRLEIGHG